MSSVESPGTGLSVDCPEEKVDLLAPTISPVLYLKASQCNTILTEKPHSPANSNGAVDNGIPTNTKWSAEALGEKILMNGQKKPGQNVLDTNNDRKRPSSPTSTTNPVDGPKKLPRLSAPAEGKANNESTPNVTAPITDGGSTPETNLTSDKSDDAEVEELDTVKLFTGSKDSEAPHKDTDRVEAASKNASCASNSRSFSLDNRMKNSIKGVIQAAVSRVGLECPVSSSNPSTGTAAVSSDSSCSAPDVSATQSHVGENNDVSMSTQKTLTRSVSVDKGNLFENFSSLTTPGCQTFNQITHRKQTIATSCDKEYKTHSISASVEDHILLGDDDGDCDSINMEEIDESILEDEPKAKPPVMDTGEDVVVLDTSGEMLEGDDQSSLNCSDVKMMDSGTLDNTESCKPKADSSKESSEGAHIDVGNHLEIGDKLAESCGPKSDDCVMDVETPVESAGSEEPAVPVVMLDDSGDAEDKDFVIEISAEDLSASLAGETPKEQTNPVQTVQPNDCKPIIDSLLPTEDTRSPKENPKSHINEDAVSHLEGHQGSNAEVTGSKDGAKCQENAQCQPIERKLPNSSMNIAASTQHHAESRDCYHQKQSVIIDSRSSGDSKQTTLSLLSKDQSPAPHSPSKTDSAVTEGLVSDNNSATDNTGPGSTNMPRTPEETEELDSSKVNSETQKIEKSNHTSDEITADCPGNDHKEDLGIQDPGAALCDVKNSGGDSCSTPVQDESQQHKTEEESMEVECLSSTKKETNCSSPVLPIDAPQGVKLGNESDGENKRTMPHSGRESPTVVTDEVCEIPNQFTADKGHVDVKPICASTDTSTKNDGGPLLPVKTDSTEAEGKAEELEIPEQPRKLRKRKVTSSPPSVGIYENKKYRAVSPKDLGHNDSTKHAKQGTANTVVKGKQVGGVSAGKSPISFDKNDFEELVKAHIEQYVSVSRGMQVLHLQNRVEQLQVELEKWKQHAKTLQQRIVENTILHQRRTHRRGSASPKMRNMAIQVDAMKMRSAQSGQTSSQGKMQSPLGQATVSIATASATATMTSMSSATGVSSAAQTLTTPTSAVVVGAGVLSGSPQLTTLPASQAAVLLSSASAPGTVTLLTPSALPPASANLPPGQIRLVRPGTMTVREMLNTQRQPAPLTTPPINVASPSTSQQQSASTAQAASGGMMIDLTEDDEGSPPKLAQGLASVLQQQVGLAQNTPVLASQLTSAISQQGPVRAGVPIGQTVATGLRPGTYLVPMCNGSLLLPVGTPPLRSQGMRPGTQVMVPSSANSIMPTMVRQQLVLPQGQLGAAPVLPTPLGMQTIVRNLGPPLQTVVHSTQHAQTPPVHIASTKQPSSTTVSRAQSSPTPATTSTTPTTTTTPSNRVAKKRTGAHKRAAVPAVDSHTAASESKHPAPLPPQPKVQKSSSGMKGMPPKPGLKISRVPQGIVLSWNMSLEHQHADVTSYQLFAYQEGSQAPVASLWKKVGDVKALPLPMACTLTQFQEGNKYHFAVRALDEHGRLGAFSDPGTIHLEKGS